MRIQLSKFRNFCILLTKNWIKCLQQKNLDKSRQKSKGEGKYFALFTLVALAVIGPPPIGCPSRQPGPTGREPQRWTGRRRRGATVNVASPAAPAAKSLESAGNSRHRVAACIQAHICSCVACMAVCVCVCFGGGAHTHTAARTCSHGSRRLGIILECDRAICPGHRSWPSAGLIGCTAYPDCRGGQHAESCRLDDCRLVQQSLCQIRKRHERKS